MSDWPFFHFRTEDNLNLIIFGAGLQQTLLYGELQQVLLLLPHAVSLFAS